MGVSPRRPWLYRKARLAVILAAEALLLTQPLSAQISPPRKKASKGPRALGLLQLFPNGTAHLIPITILIDGNFYDAGAYKAAPVPMALESQTVYEAVHSGVSLGVFTVGGVRQTKDSWIADGSWLPTGSAPPKTAHKAETKPNMGTDEGPPVLHRPGGKKPTESQPPSSASSPDNKQPASDASPKETSPATPSSAPTPAPPQTAAPPDTSSSSSTAATAPAPVPEDTDRPTLRRGRPSPATASKQPPSATAATPKSLTTKSSASPAPSPASSKNSVQLIPAISDANGPDPRPYLYETKPDEDEKFRKKVLAMATDELLAKVKAYAGTPAEQPSPASTRPRKGAPPKTPQPVFDDVQLKIFDLSSSNEPVLVLTATAHMPPSPKSEPSTAADTQYFVTLVTRNDIYGDLHKVFSNITDNHHLDVIPRMELVDAVDADGDGRGELLFRKVSDSGSAYNVYRQIGDQLWPLFEGTLP